jgi:hypothetical protein
MSHPAFGRTPRKRTATAQRIYCEGREERQGREPQRRNRVTAKGAKNAKEESRNDATFYREGREEREGREPQRRNGIATSCIGYVQERKLKFLMALGLMP